MKHWTLLTGILALAAPLALAQPSSQVTTWTSDQRHSEVDFSIRHMSVSNVHGRIGDVAATIVLNGADITKSTVTATIGVSTIDTGVAARDADLKSAGFFDIAKFPTATFTSTSVAKSAGDLLVTGNLTLHGVPQPVVLVVTGPSGPVMGMMDHKPHAGFSASTTLSRAAFGIGAKYPAALIGDQVNLTLDLELIQQ